MKKSLSNRKIIVARLYLTRLFFKVGKYSMIAILLAFSLALLSGRKPFDSNESIIWKLENPAIVGGIKTTILGKPKVERDKTGMGIAFDGIDDGLIIPVNPVAGWKQFTVEVLFKPVADGPIAPRFVHFEDQEGNRGTIEARITPQGDWYLDTFLKNGKSNSRLTLIDSANLHPCDRWYWVSLVYDGEKMAHYINGVKEMEGKVDISPMIKGQISLGVRLNKVNWFKGVIKEIRFHPTALSKEALQR